MIRQPLVHAIVFAIIAPVALSLPAQAAPLSQSIAQKRITDATTARKPPKPGGKDATTGQSQPGPRPDRPTPLNPDR